MCKSVFIIFKTCIFLLLKCLYCRVQSSIARAVVVLDAVPDKLNPVIRPLMECIKREENTLLQVRTEQRLFWPRR